MDSLSKYLGFSDRDIMVSFLEEAFDSMAFNPVELRTMVDSILQAGKQDRVLAA